MAVREGRLPGQGTLYASHSDFLRAEFRLEGSWKGPITVRMTRRAGNVRVTVPGFSTSPYRSMLSLAGGRLDPDGTGVIPIDKPGDHWIRLLCNGLTVARELARVGGGDQELTLHLPPLHVLTVLIPLEMQWATMTLTSGQEDQPSDPINQRVQSGRVTFYGIPSGRYLLKLDGSEMHVQVTGSPEVPFAGEKIRTPRGFVR